ncbi:hypothetical protein CcaCcLH18_13936 [Colletotrichum camelliae]|nr:hypothetical protein CcaCcLH18_13936 [Colletotrichum camelliae]
MHNQLNNSILPSSTQDNYPYHPIDIEAARESSIKCLGTYKTMASPTSTSPAPAPAAVSPRPLHPNVYRPTTPPSPAAPAAAPSQPAANFVLRTVAILRLLALVFAIVLLVLEFEGRRHYSFTTFFIVVAFFQLFWLALSLLSEILPPLHHGRRKGVTLDFGVVKCIFGRSGYPDDSDDEEAGGMLLMGFAGDVPRKWNRRDLLFSVVDLALGSTTFGIAVTNVKGGGMWYAWETYHTIGAIAMVVASFEFVIAVAQQVPLLKRARIRISHDEEGDEDAGSHKYRIRLPESPERGRPAMSVASHTAI